MAATVKPAVAKLLGEDVVLYCGASLPCNVFDLVVLLALSYFPICGVVEVGTLSRSANNIAYRSFKNRTV